jgi:hypothetical protein
MNTTVAKHSSEKILFTGKVLNSYVARDCRQDKLFICRVLQTPYTSQLTPEKTNQL